MRLSVPKPESENDHQKLCVEYAAKIGLGPYLIAIPNGTQLPGGPAARGRYMNHLKAMGLKPGASDLFLAKPVKLAPAVALRLGRLWHHGAWFEMKRVTDSRTSKDQREFLAYMANEGYYVDVCKGFDAFQSSLSRYLRGEDSEFVIRMIYRTS